MAQRRTDGFQGRAGLGWAAGLCLAAALACGGQSQETDSAGDSSATSDAGAMQDVAADKMAAVDADVADATQIQESGFVYKEIAVAKESARSGAGQTITAGGKTLTLQGQEIKVGDPLPKAMLVGAGSEAASLVDGSGHVRIVSVVPALMTATCEQQTHYLSEKNGGLEDQLELITVSIDPPSVQKEFAEKAQIENVTFLSDAREAAFGSASGLLIENPRLLARAVMVVDEENVVRYLQVVPELTSMPDMDAAFAFARTLVEDAS